MKRDGYDRLWGWFGLSYASWITIPRALAHEMPDDWQMKMAELLEEYSEATRNAPDDVSYLKPMVVPKKGARFTRWPSWILNYRHPNQTMLRFMQPPAGSP